MVFANPTSHSSSDIKQFKYEDLKLSFTLFKENFYPIIMVGLIGSGLYYLVDFIVDDFIFPLILWDNYQVLGQIIIYNLFKLPQQGLLYGFFGAIMGMVRDVMGSGDGFTQIQNFFGYIAKYWGKFFLLSVIVNIFTYVQRFSGQEIQNFNLSLIFRIISFFWFIILVETSPALVDTKKIFPALKENFNILRKFSKRIFVTFSLYYVIFLLPLSICFFLHYYVFPADGPSVNILSIIEILFYLFYILIGLPIDAFLATSIYNDYKFQQ